MVTSITLILHAAYLRRRGLPNIVHYAVEGEINKLKSFNIFYYFLLLNDFIIQEGKKGERKRQGVTLSGSSSGTASGQKAAPSTKSSPMAR